MGPGESQRFFSSILYHSNSLYNWKIHGEERFERLKRAYHLKAAISIALLIFFDFCKYHKITLRQEILKQDFWVRGLVIGISICIILLFGVWGSQMDNAAFIYYQF